MNDDSREIGGGAEEREAEGREEREAEGRKEREAEGREEREAEGREEREAEGNVGEGIDQGEVGGKEGRGKGEVREMYVHI